MSAKETSHNKSPSKAQDARAEPAGIEYVGTSGASAECRDAVLRFIQWGDRITNAKILSSSHDHCLLLAINVGDLVAVKSGFASGYGGEGPHTFSYVLQILDSHGSEIEEYDVPPDLLDRVDQSALTVGDLEMIANCRPRRPARWHDYIDEKHWRQSEDGTLWQDEFPPVVPLAVVNSRVIDVAVGFWENPDHNLLIGYRRLEDLVRQRTGLQESSTRLFSQAFHPETGQLTWSGIDKAECIARMNLFVGAYGAHRNRRAHRESSSNREDLLSEFLLLNHLYRLHAESVGTDGPKNREHEP